MCVKRKKKLQAQTPVTMDEETKPKKREREREREKQGALTSMVAQRTQKSIRILDGPPISASKGRLQDQARVV